MNINFEFFLLIEKSYHFGVEIEQTQAECYIFECLNLFHLLFDCYYYSLRLFKIPNSY